MTGAELPARYTLAEAAKGLGVSTRTLRRRLKDGDLSGQKQLRGKQEVWTIDAAELARYAESTGQKLQLAAGAGGQRGAEISRVNVSSTDNNAADSMAMAALRAEVDYLRRTLADTTRDRDYLREILGNVTRALPPPRPPTPERRVSWWRRLLKGAK